MKTILVPTDFSAHAYTALRYAADLAERQRARLVLLHVFHKAVYWFETPGQVQQKESAQRAESQRKMQELRDSPALGGRNVQVSYTVRNGRTVDEIVQLAGEINVDMIVMGCGRPDAPEAGFRTSTATEVMEKTTCPLLIVPRGTGYRPIARIVSSVDYHASDLLHTIELTEIAGLFNANITLVHLTNPGTAPQEALYSLNQLQTKARTHTQYQQLHAQLLVGDDSIHRLNEYMSRHRADLLVMASRKRNAVDRVSGYSFTRQMIFHTTVPTLVYKAFDWQTA